MFIPVMIKSIEKRLWLKFKKTVKEKEGKSIQFKIVEMIKEYLGIKGNIKKGE